MTLFAAVSSNLLGYLGLAIVVLAIVVLLISTFHPEGRKRPGGYLDGKAPQPGDRTAPRPDDVRRDEGDRPLH